MNVRYAPPRLRHGPRALGLRLGINYKNQIQTHSRTHNVDSNLGLTSWTHTEHHTGPVMAHIRSPWSNAPTAPPRIAFGPHLLGSPSSSSPSLPPRPSSPVYASLCYSPPRHHFAVADAGIRTPTQKARSRRVGDAHRTNRPSVGRGGIPPLIYERGAEEESEGGINSRNHPASSPGERVTTR